MLVLGLVSSRPSAGRIVLVALVVTLLLSGTASTQPGGSATAPPSVADLGEQLEEIFAAAVAMSDRDDVEPMGFLQGWGAVMMTATVLEARRAQEEGRAPDNEGTQEALLERWQSLRPDSAGPELFRLLRIQDQAQRLPGLLGLVERYPDDPQLLWQAGTTLRSFGRADEARELLEAHARRHPQSATAWRLLAEHHGSLRNETEQMAALARWAEVAPGDPTLIERWIGAGLERVDPEGSARLIGRFLEESHDDPRALEICGRLARSGASPHRDAARRCVARIAGGSSAGSAATDEAAAQVRERAVALLAELAADAGDWSGLLDSLEALAPAARGRALVASARRVEAPAQCSQRVELLRAALDSVSADQTEDRLGHSSIASAAWECRQRPVTQSLFLDLLEAAPVEDVSSVLGAWAVRVNGSLRGEIPAETASRLEARLEREPGASGLYRALATVYELEGEVERRFELLRRFSENAPESMRGQEATDLAFGLAARGEPEAAVAFLEGRIARVFSTEEAELLWQIHAEPVVAEDAEWPDEAAWLDALERADRFAGELMSSGEAHRAAFGQLLAARGAILRGDAAAAERYYLGAMRTSEQPRDEWVTEMLDALAETAGAERLVEIATEVCGSTALTQRHRGREACATTLLARSGNDEAVSKLAEVTGELPDDEQTLTSLARAVRDSDPELAERAWRRLLELDPMDENVWSGYAAHLAARGRLEEVEAVLPQVRARFGKPSTQMLRTVARARLDLGRPEEAIELLEEARAGLPESASTAWIDADLRKAYTAIGRRERQAAARRSDQQTSPSSLQPLTDEERTELEARASSAASPEDGGRALLALAEALRTGMPFAEGAPARYDPRVAESLFERAAATGDPVAAYRLAIVRSLGSDAVPAADLAAVESLAERGDAYGRYLAGTGALLGVGRERDLEAARRWLELAAESEERTPAVAWSHHNLAWMAETGAGLDAGRDLDRALDGYRHSGDLGNVSSLYDFARLTLSGFDAELCREGLARLERAATVGHPRAVAYLGKVRLYGIGCATSDATAARPWLEAALAAGDSGARYDLGLLLLLSGDQGTERGLELLAEAADHQSALAIETLHLARASGAFARRDLDRARAWGAEATRFGSDGLAALRRELAYPPGQRLFEEATARLERLVADGDAAARPLLAAILLDGPYEHRDPERGFLIAREAAATGDSWALRLVAEALEEGNGVEADATESLRFTHAAAEAGDPFAMLELSAALMSGERIEPDLEAGEEWLRRAAEAGLWQAVGELARLYVEGRPGVAARPELAAPWKRLRAELGDDEAHGWLVAHGYALR